MKKTLLMVSAIALIAIALANASPGVAQSFPGRPVRIVVPFAAGGGVDILARLLAKELQDAWGQAVIVEDRPGGGGSLGTHFVAHTSPDGYTLLLGYDGPLVIAPLITVNWPVDTLRDLEPVTKIVDVPLIVVANPSVPVNSIRDVIEYAKNNPGKLNYASTGVGGTPHMVAELLKSIEHIQMTHIPYKGGGAALPDVMGGQVQLLFIALPGAQAAVSDGRLRGIAVTTARRSLALPDVATIAESGLPELAGFDVPSWFAMMAPKGTPPEIVSQIQKSVAVALNQPAIRAKLRTLGFSPVAGTPAELSQEIKADIEKWSKVVSTAGIKAK